MKLKPQDFLVALKLVAWGEQRWTYARLAHELGLSVSEAHACVRRALHAGLLQRTDEGVVPAAAASTGRAAAKGIYRIPGKLRRATAPKEGSAGPESDVAPASAGPSGPPVLDNPARPHARQLAEFAVHGARYAFAAERATPSKGVPTAHVVLDPEESMAERFVWPHPNGKARGIAVKPLHPAVPYAATQDARLYELLALFDLMRLGTVRERSVAARRLNTLIDPISDAKRMLVPTAAAPDRVEPEPGGPKAQQELDL